MFFLILVLSLDDTLSVEFLCFIVTIPKIIKEIYVIIFKILWKAGLSILPKKLPNKIAIPWLKNEPSATPK